MKTNEIVPTKIKAERLQTRAVTNSNYIDELAERMAAGDTFPDITIFTDGKESWLADGIHRLDAAIKAKKKIGVHERKGTLADAIEFACGANDSHGLRLTNADKRRKVQLALSHFPDRSSRLISEMCGVSNHLVDEIRGGNSPTCNKNTEKTRVGRDGKRQPAAKPEPVNKATDFDPETLEQQPPREDKPKASGKPTISRQDRTNAQKHLGGLIRSLSAMGIYDEFATSLSQVATRLKQV